MCQVQEESFKALNVLESNIGNTQKLCAKCENVAIIIVGTNGTFCQDCFEKYITHKFRASMGKNPIVRHGDKVAVAFSGGTNSAGLLQLIQSGLSPDTPRRLKFVPGILFIDETALAQENQSLLIENVESIMAQTGFPYHTILLEEAFNCQSVESCSSDSNKPRASDKLLNMFQSAKTLTAKNELVYRMRCRLLSQKAKELGYDHVFLAETSTRLALNMMSNVALGRGAHVTQDAGFSDEKRFLPFGVNLLRPLRDITAKEMVVYAKMHDIPTVFLPNTYTGHEPMSSIQHLTERFLLGLVAGYPSTEMTVYRTSNKLQSTTCDKSAAVNVNRCCVCHGQIDMHIDVDQATALKDTLLSENISSGAMQDGKEYIPSKSEKLNKSHLCYACTVMSKEFSDPLLSMWPEQE